MTEDDMLDHLAGFRREAARFGTVAATADLSLPVPCCPGWDAGDLVAHVARVYDLFHQVIAGRLTERDQVAALQRIERTPGVDVVAMFDEQRALLDADLAGTTAEDRVWNWAYEEPGGGWVRRRMLHETLIHRFDLEAAVGAEHADVSDAAAIDGLDELLAMVALHGGRWDGPLPVTLAVDETISGRAWALRLEPGQRAVPADVPTADADVRLRGAALDLLLAGWGRAPVDGLLVAGTDDAAGAVLSTIGR